MTNALKEKDVVEEQVGIEKELNHADVREIFVGTSSEEDVEHSLEDKQWTGSFDAEERSSVIVSQKNWEATKMSRRQKYLVARAELLLRR